MNNKSTKSHEPQIAHVNRTTNSKAPLKRFLFACLLLYGHFTLNAATITVINGTDADPGSLRQAIASAVAGDVIDFGVGVTTVTLTSGELLINKNLTINGGTGGVTITRDAAAADFRIFKISGAVAVFNKLSITNGKAPLGFDNQAGGVANNGTLTLNDCIVANNGAAQGGGLQNNGTMTMNRCVVHSNNSGSGSGLIIYGSSTTLNNCVFTNNSGAYAIAIRASVTLTITNCTIAKNTAGGISVGNGGAVLTLKNTIVAENTRANIFNTGTISSAYNLIGTEGGNGGLTNGTNNNLVGVLPFFADSSDPDGADNIFGTADDGLRVTACNFATNAGNNADVPPVLPVTDIVGNARIFGTAVDMGAYEFQATSTPPPTITLGTIAPILAGATTFILPYTATTSSPITYSISGTGITTVTDAALPSSPITVNLSQAASGGIINFILTVKNANGCTSTATTGYVVVNTPLTQACATATFNGTAPVAPTASTAGVGGRGGLHIYTVPAGVTAIRLDAKGAKGGSSPITGGGRFRGGFGGRVQATYAVTPGDVLYILVGGKGGDGSPDNRPPIRTASGGGGATVVSKGPIGSGTLLLVAGAGGGAGGIGMGGEPNNTPGNGAGVIGAGGASFSAAGGNSVFGNNCGEGGQALNAGGNGGANTCFKPETNGGGYGGGGAGNYNPNNNAAGGGGGGGYIGGNAGGVGGGNGGSSYTDPSATNLVPMLGDPDDIHSDDNGSVVITIPATISYTGSPFCISLTATGTPTTTAYTGGTFSSTAGLTIDATTGVINPSTSTVGTYTVSYNMPALVGCTAATTPVTIGCLEIATPSVGFILCQGGSTTISATAIPSGGSGAVEYSLNGGAYQTDPVFTVQAGTYIITAKEGSGSTLSTAPIVVQDGASPIQCPQPITVDASQMNADGTVPTSVSGNVRIVSQCLTPSSTAVTDQVFDVNCGVVSPQTNSFSASSLVNVQKAILRAFSASSGIITYTCYQTIFVRQPKLEDVVFPANRTLTCTNLRTEPTDGVVNNAFVTGTGSPSSAGSTLNETALKGLTATYTDVRTTTPTGFTIQRTWTVTKCVDGNTNNNTTRTFIQTITVPTCTTPSIAGSIGREDGTAVPATTLLFNSLTGRTDSTTGVNYSFANILTNSNIRVKPTRPNTDWTSGVTMLDVSLLSKHLLDVNRMISPYSIISADVNGDGEVDATDMLLMQRLILRLIPALPNTNSWRFVVKNHVFRNPSNPLASDFPEILVVPNLTSALANGDFVAIKVGDLNQSAGAVNIRGGAKAFMLNTEDKVLEQGKTYQILIQLTPSVSSLQFTLNVDKTAAKINSIESGNLPNFTDNNTGLFQKEGLITAAWYRKNGELLSETDNFTMMTVSLTPTKTTRLSEIMTINSAYTEGVAYDAKGNGAPVQLAFGNKTASSEKAVLLQNRPNPFSNETTLSFTLHEASKAKLTVCDLLGKVLMSSERTFAKGLNEVVFDATHTPSVSGGFFVVRLQTATGVAEQKIVLSR